MKLKVLLVAQLNKFDLIKLKTRRHKAVLQCQGHLWNELTQA